MTRGLLVVALLLAFTPCARASWLDDAWPPDTVTAGSPAITLNAELGVIVVLPASTLAAARRAGLDTKAALTLFLERYAQQCSDVIDLNRPQQHLPVALSLARPYFGGRLVVTDEDEDEAHFVIDYVPAKIVHCVEPGEEAPVS